MDTSRLLHRYFVLFMIIYNYVWKVYNWFLYFILLFLESEAQELESIGLSVIVITYYENQQQLLPSYMTRLAWSFYGMFVTF